MAFKGIVTGATNLAFQVTNWLGSKTGPHAAIEYLPLGTSDGSATGQVGLKVIAIGGSSAPPSVTGALTNRSGTISGATTVAASNSSRKYFVFMNTGSNNMSLSFGGGGGLTVFPAGSFTFEGTFIASSAVTVTGTNGDTFAAYEG